MLENSLGKERLKRKKKAKPINIRLKLGAGWWLLEFKARLHYRVDGKFWFVITDSFKIS